MLDCMPKLTTWFLAYPGIQILDLTGPFEVFNTANLVLERRQETANRYELRVVSAQRTVVASSGLEISASDSSTELPAPGESPGLNPHTLLIPGGAGVPKACGDADLVDWVRKTAEADGRFATVCTGAFVAGAAGLLKDRQVTTHWNHLRELNVGFPDAIVDTDAIFVRDGDLWSSAGVTAGIDLALALVETSSISIHRQTFR